MAKRKHTYERAKRKRRALRARLAEAREMKAEMAAETAAADSAEAPRE
ncbi:MAG: hypothetical protein ABIV28_08855 [Longimicrobiales bacterium]